MNLSFFLFAFSSLIALVNPVGISPVFVTLTQRFPAKDIPGIALRSTFSALVILVTFAAIGDFIFSFFGITLHAFRIVGGILFFRSGLKMLESIPSRTRSTPKEQEEALHRQDLAITPIGIPLIAGPGAITSSMILASHAENIGSKLSLLAAMVAVLFVTYLVLRGADTMLSKIGTTGARVIQRIMGLLLMVIAVQFVIDGVTPVLQNILQGAG